MEILTLLGLLSSAVLIVVATIFLILLIRQKDERGRGGFIFFSIFMIVYGIVGIYLVLNAP